jgi:hypothetical protein
MRAGLLLRSGTWTRDRLLACTTCLFVLPAGTCAGHAWAQPVIPDRDTELSKEIENPVTRQVMLPLRFESGFDSGAYRATKNTAEIDQAVIPLRLIDDWALITRTKLPAISQPPKHTGNHWVDGLDNGYTTFFLSPEHGEGFYWGAGPVLYYPTATHSALGVNKWGTGPSVAFVKKDQSPWQWGVVVNNIWSFGGPPSSNDQTNSFLLNPFVSYHFDGGWSVGSSPNITADWLAKSGQQWKLPVGGGFSNAFRFGTQPMKLGLDGYYNALRAQANQDTWILQLTLTFVFPN